ncbi:MAG: outer membrane protein transport protein [Deltaproteobacteria bacterium]|nr:outer membrane protein transport protein [Deltaproteobacteria bacterium]
MGTTGLWRLLGAMAVLLGATESRGAGFEFPDNGTEALGRGAAFTAKADDLTAIQYNIAGLAKLRGTHLLIDLNLANQSYTFARAGNYPDDSYRLGGTEYPAPWSGQPFPRIHKQPEAYPIPIGAVATDFGLRRFTFAFGLNGPSSMGRKKFPDKVTLPDGTVAPAPQRFDLVDEDILIGFFTLAAAWRPLDWLYVGAAFQYTIANVKEHVYAIAYLNQPGSPEPCRNAEADACSSKAGINVWDWWVPTGILSVLARPPRLNQLEIGASFRFPFETSATGSGSMSLPTAMQGFDITATGASLKTKMPHSLRTGVRWFFGPREDEKGDVEVDVVWEGWSRVKTFDSTFTLTIQNVDITVPHRYRDTVSVRTGGAYNFKLGRNRDQRLTLRAGFFWESAAAPDEYTRLDFDGFERFGATVGVGYKVRGITFNLAFAYIYMPTRNVTNSQVTPIYAIFDPPTEPSYLNGKFESRMWVLSLGAAVSFDELLKKRSGMR